MKTSTFELGLSFCERISGCCLSPWPPDALKIAQSLIVRSRSATRHTMKVRIADKLPIVPLGSGNLMGKVLVSLEDNVGFSMHEFHAKPGDEVKLSAFHPNHNHIYYCIEGMLCCK